MDTTIRNLDEEAYRALKAQAALEGKSIGEAASDAIWYYVSRFPAGPRTGRLADFKPVKFPPGNERLSEEVDEVVYGVKLD